MNDETRISMDQRLMLSLTRNDRFPSEQFSRRIKTCQTQSNGQAKQKLGTVGKHRCRNKTIPPSAFKAKYEMYCLFCKFKSSFGERQHNYFLDVHPLSHAMPSQLEVKHPILHDIKSLSKYENRVRIVSQVEHLKEIEHGKDGERRPDTGFIPLYLAFLNEFVDFACVAMCFGKNLLAPTT
ncbi:hypothetical protein MAR_023090 [Mya arenaria]|uniref:Uncharacterized protein n=1 Tax=Mya arenaria TaxID=6604 RepID=A0ABY7DPS8_MYAAR|nr:hypothetical protein MAR_023090 [Mya arenaria]